MSSRWRFILVGVTAAALAAWSWNGLAQNDTPRPAEVRGAAPDAEQTTPPLEARAWQPKPVNPTRYRDIVDFNIFLSDRNALAREAAERLPQPVVAEVEAPVETVAADPDAEFVLVGVVLHGSQRQAFIEDRRRGEVRRVPVPGDFSAGRLESIRTAGVTYRIDGEDRPIAVGENFLGTPMAIAPVAERPQPEEFDEFEDIEESNEDYAERFGRRPTPEDIERIRRQRPRE
ncbi:MAG: hypothetical protein AAGL98_01110 [Planctomycetota bacterium]